MAGAKALRRLADCNPFDPALLEKPLEAYAALRREAPEPHILLRGLAELRRAFRTA